MIDSLEERCAGLFENPPLAARELRRISQGARDGGDRLLDLLAAVPDPDGALAHLHRFARLRPLPAGEESLRALCQILGHSDYLSDLVLSDPSRFDAALGARGRSIPTSADHRGAARAAVGGAAGDGRWRLLMRYKDQATLDVALRDSLREWSLPEVAEQISFIAGAILAQAVEMIDEDLRSRHGPPACVDEEGRRQDASAVLVALGKLGGRELNYSSDVDLLLVYSIDGETRGIEGKPRSAIGNKEFFTLLAQILTSRLSSPPGGGWLLRPDWGLRPGGQDGDLTLPLPATLAYYRSWARPWERQALIKARPVAGDLELGRQFLAELQEIVYPASPPPDAIDAIRHMKDKIDASLAGLGAVGEDLKLGRGGIREIEFSIQGRQILHAGGDAWLREANSLHALHRLAERGHLPRLEHRALADAYLFLREAEHRIQIRRNLQRSALPADGKEKRVLARAMGHLEPAGPRAVDEFLALLHTHQDAVRSHYDAFLAAQAQELLDLGPAPDPFLDPMGEAEVQGQLEQAGWSSAGTLTGIVKRIARLLTPQASSAAVRRAFRRLTPILMRQGVRLGNAPRALRNLERLLESLTVDENRLQYFLERPERLPAILRLLEGSQPLSNLLIHRPELIGEQSFENALAAEPSLRAHQTNAAARVAGGQSLARMMAELRRYQQAETLLIGLKDLSHQLSLRTACRALSVLAEACLRVALDVAAEAEGIPRQEGRPFAGFCILALGRLGYREMDYGSDLDLVFLYRAGPGDAEAHARANALAARVHEVLTTITREGALYAVDTRLRPFGSEGELAQPAESLVQYLRGPAGVWEMQSYLKARSVAGDIKIGQRLMRRAERAILDRATREDLAGAVRAMRDKLRAASLRPGEDLRSGPGGTHTIQFALQYLQLRHHVPSPPRKSTLKLLTALRDLALIDDDSYAALFKGERLLRRFEHQLRLIQGRAITQIPSNAEIQSEVARGLGYPSERAEAMLDDLGESRRDVEAAFDRIVP